MVERQRGNRVAGNELGFDPDDDPSFVDRRLPAAVKEHRGVPEVAMLVHPGQAGQQVAASTCSDVAHEGVEVGAARENLPDRGLGPHGEVCQGERPIRFAHSVAGQDVSLGRRVLRGSDRSLHHDNGSRRNRNWFLELSPNEQRQQ